MARKIAGYYNEPAYQDHPWEARRVSVAQLEQMLEAARGSKDNEVVQELSGVELTERMSSTRLSSSKGRLPGERSRAALVAVADRSAFLALPARGHSGCRPAGPCCAATDALAHGRVLDQDHAPIAGLLRDANDNLI